MIFDYTTKGKLKITMYQYVTGVIEHVPDVYKSGARKATPALNHLYDVRDLEDNKTEVLKG